MWTLRAHHVAYFLTTPCINLIKNQISDQLILDVTLFAITRENIFSRELIDKSACFTNPFIFFHLSWLELWSFLDRHFSCICIRPWIIFSWMLILGVSIPLLPFSNQGFTVSLIVFAFFLAGFVAPSFAVLHQLFKNSKNMFDVIFWFSLGSIISSLCLGVGGRVGFILNFPLAGMLIFSASTVMCLIGILTYSHASKLLSNGCPAIVTWA